MFTPSVVRALLVTTALGHFVTIPALALAPRWGILLRAELGRLSPINARIVLVVMFTIQGVLVGTGGTMLWACDDVLAGGRLAAATTLLLSLLWLGRLGVQLRVYGPLFSSPRLRVLHVGLAALFAYMATAYALVWWHLPPTP
jgi:hypothetical protein